jgi:uncharacterized protein YdhG (YjbR/CyaY superfamily)
MKIATVDEFVKLKVLPEQSAIVALIRKMMRELAPETKEVISYGLPMWRGNKLLAWFNPTKQGVTFSFTYGAGFEDKYKLLHGVGKVARHVKFADVKDVNKAALRYYIKQALKLDKAAN